MSEHTTFTDYRSILRSAFEQRCSRNARYSLRAFARDLEISPARLSEVLSEKQGLSRAWAEKIAGLLGLSPRESQIFCDSVEAKHSKSPFKRKAAAARLAHSVEFARSTLQMDTFALISDWYHFAILELTAVDGFRSDAGWIARRLGLQKEVVKNAVERLIRLKLLKEDSVGNWVATDDFTASPDGVPSEALKKYHQQILERAAEALYTQSIDERDITNMMLAFDRQNLPNARKLIREFRRGFSKLASSSKDISKEQKDSVYCLGIQFFRMDRATSIAKEK